MLMKISSAALLLGCAAVTQAQEVGNVLSRTAVYQQVTVPRQTCSQMPVAVQRPSSGAGALLGAIVGGVVGHQFGNGAGSAATMAGAFGGAIMGDKIENPGAELQNQTTCTTQNIYENRLVGFNVVYEYAGKQYSVQLPQDPGPTIQLQVTPMGAARSETLTAPPVVYSQAVTTTVIQEPRVVYVPAPVYRNYPPIYTHINLGWGYSSGFGDYGGRHRHWR